VSLTPLEALVLGAVLGVMGGACLGFLIAALFASAREPRALVLTVVTEDQHGRVLRRQLREHTPSCPGRRATSRSPIPDSRSPIPGA
jgi:hypothetical protein